LAFDYQFIYIISIVVAAGGIVATQLWNNKQRKDRVEERREMLAHDTEKIAMQKSREEKETADSLSNNAAALALNVKQDMKEHIDRLIVILKQDIELQRVLTYGKIDSLDTKVAQVKIDLMQHIIDEKEDRIRMQRSIDFIQTLQFGPEAKSIPAYATGDIETQEEIDAPEKGIFASRQDTTHKDTEDPPLKSDEE